MERLHLSLSNVHCKDCEKAIHASLSKFLFIKPADETFSTPPERQVYHDSEVVVYKLNNKELDFYYENSNNGVNAGSPSMLQHYIKKIVKAITKSGFNVLSWEFFEDNEPILHSQVHDANHSTAVQKVGNISDWFNLFSRFESHQNEKQHLKYCQACLNSSSQSKKRKSMFSSSSSSKLGSQESLPQESFETVVAKPSQEYRAVFLVSGMTCSSCVGSVSETIQSILESENISTKNAEGEANYSVNLIQHSAVVIIPNKHTINSIVNAVEDSGFECRLVEVLPVQRSINLKVTAIIGGITCAACANSIQSAVKDLSFVLENGINVVTKSGTFVMEDSIDESEDNLAKLKETVEDCGFDFEVVSVDKINYTSGKKSSRSINVGVEGMYCGHCPEIITNYLDSFGEAIVIEDPITLKHPFIKFTYIPNQESNLTIRRFLDDLNHLHPIDNDPGYKIDSDKDGTFQCKLIESVSMDEHLRKLTRRETMKVVRRLLIAIAFTIPTFIFGVVAMSLLPSSNKFRMWVEEPIWVGNVSRNTWILLILATPVYFFAADIFHIKALKEIWSLWTHRNSYKKRIFRFGSMNLLVSLGTSVSYFASIALLILASRQERHTHQGLHTTYFDSVVFLSFFLLIGRLLEMISKSKTADAISGLSELKVHQATLVEPIKTSDGDTKYDKGQLIETKYLEADDLIIIASGESPPVDCIIIQGNTEFDESALTGESIPVKHSPGHQIFSGTVNSGNNSIIAKIISLEGDSLIDQIVSTVRDGQLRKAPIARTADLLTGYFVPIIVLLAVITFVVWIGLAYSGKLPDDYLDVDLGGWTVWSLEFAIAVFVIACPCGLGLAAPTALFVGSGLAAKYGILAKGGGVAFQDGANANVACFDKTGTLTYGELKVTDFGFITKQVKLEERIQFIKKLALQVTRDLEISSKHPISKAIKTFIEENNQFQNIRPSQNKVPQVENVPGKGLKGEIILDDDSGELWNKYRPKQVILGNESLMKDNLVEITTEQIELLNKWKTECKSVILVAVKCFELFEDDGFHLVLILACRDQVRKETRLVMDYLQNKIGIECWMITGDNKLTADAIGKEIGILPNHIISEVLPDQKQSQIKMIQKLKNNNIVAMIGDGINDAPALSAADVGIALASGADLAVTSSDFILLNKLHPLVTLVTLFNLSRVVFRRVKFNFGWSLIYNCIGIPIAAGVIYPYNNSRLSPVWASAAMAFSSVSVITSSLALKFYRPKIKAENLRQLEEEEEETTNEDINEINTI